MGKFGMMLFSQNLFNFINLVAKNNLKCQLVLLLQLVNRFIEVCLDWNVTTFYKQTLTHIFYIF